MIVKLMTEHHLQFLSLKGGAQARLSLHMSKCNIIGNYISRLNYVAFLLLFYFVMMILSAIKFFL